ncbi:hypothetical protein [Nocardia sp. NPDC005978]
MTALATWLNRSTPMTDIISDILAQTILKLLATGSASGSAK